MPAPFDSKILTIESSDGGGRVYVLETAAGDPVVAPFNGALTSVDGDEITFTRDDGVSFTIMGVRLNNERLGLDSSEPADTIMRWAYVSKGQQLAVANGESITVSASRPMGEPYDPMLLFTGNRHPFPSPPPVTIHYNDGPSGSPVAILMLLGLLVSMDRRRQ